MAKGKGLALLGLIIGAMGLGVGGYSYWLLQSEIAANAKAQGDLEDEIEDLEDDMEDPAIINAWYVSDDYEDIDSTPNSEVIGDMWILITVNSGESVYISFTAATYVPYMATCHYKIKMDGSDTSPVIDTDVSNFAGGAYILVGACMQGTIESLSAGIYNITAEASFTTSPCASYDNYLYIHTFR